MVGVEFNAPPDTVQVISEAVFTADHLTDTDKQKTVHENTDKQTQYKSEKVNNLKYSKTKLPWFSVASYNTRPGNEVGLFYNAPKPTRGYFCAACDAIAHCSRIQVNGTRQRRRSAHEHVGG